MFVTPSRQTAEGIDCDIVGILWFGKTWVFFFYLTGTLAKLLAEASEIQKLNICFYIVGILELKYY